ncbi:MAG: hypothetical protein WD871_06060 [Xanthobacteraceae bacterium]
MIAANTKDKADAAFKKQVRIREGTKAMTEYQASRVAEENKTERLRTLRLARATEETPPLMKRKSPGAKIGS